MNGDIDIGGGRDRSALSGTDANERRVDWSLNLSRLKWLAIFVPLAFLFALDYLRHEVFFAQLHGFPGVLLLLAVLAAAVSAFSLTIFHVIHVLERRVLEQNRQLSALARIAAASAESPDLNDLLNVALDHVLSVMSADAGVICLLDAEAEELVATCHRGFSEEIIQRIRRQKLGEEPIGTEVVRTGRPVVMEELLNTPATAELARREGFHSAISLPLKADGQVSGVLAVASREERHFPPGEVELLTAIGGQLGMAVRNAMLFAQTQQRNQELTALLAVGRALTSSLDLSAMLDQALHAVIDVTTAETAEVWLMEPDGELALAMVRGLATEAFREKMRLRVGEGLPGLAAETGSAVVVHDLASDPRFQRPGVIRAGFQTFCTLPLRHRDETVGVLTVAARDAAALSGVAEHRLLEGIGEQLAIAIENAHLHERVLDVAVLEERERIARELHDGLAQVLGYINTQTLAIRKLLLSGDAAQVHEELRAMEEAVRLVYADVREAIVGLRISVVEEGGLVPSLRAYVERYSQMTGVHVEPDVSDAAAAVRLPASAEIQLMRIIQESLSNVRKHARASSVRVSLETAGDTLVIKVVDDGQGFDATRPPRAGWPRFGLQTMRERAQSIGGALEVLSQPGAGTSVIVTVPLRKPVEVPDESFARR